VFSQQWQLESSCCLLYLHSNVKSIRALSKVAVNILYKQFDFRIVNFTTSAILQYRCPFSVDY